MVNATAGGHTACVMSHGMARNECFSPVSGLDILESGRSKQDHAMSAREGQLGRIALRAYLLALAVTLGGCSATELVQNLPPAPAADLSQPNYRRVVGDNIKAIFPYVTSLGDLEISRVRLVDHLKGPAWMTCLKLDAHGKPQVYALFIQGDKIIDSRVGVVMDQCYKETFEPFELPSPPAAKKVGP
jgi:hypothetical protein